MGNKTYTAKARRSLAGALVKILRRRSALSDVLEYFVLVVNTFGVIISAVAFFLHKDELDCKILNFGRELLIIAWRWKRCLVVPCCSAR